jgi:hypothetical protein
MRLNHLGEIPGPLSKIWVSLGFIYTATKVLPYRRIASVQIRFRVLQLSLAPIDVIVTFLGRWNSRQFYMVPVELKCSDELTLRLRLTRLPLGLALRYALNPCIDLQVLDKSSRHYSVWGDSRLKILEEFLSTRAFYRSPFMGFGGPRGPAWSNVMGEERHEGD